MSFRSALSNSKIDFMKLHKLALVMSIFFIIASISLVFTKGLNFGIDFAGGILIEARMNEDVKVSQIRNLLAKEVKDVQIQNIKNENPELGKADFLIRISKSDQEQSDLVKKIQEILNDSFGKIEYRKVDYVGPQIGSELIQKGILALFLSFIFIMVYISFRFDWQFGIGAIFALIHDAVLTLGFFALTQIEFNTTSIAALLTIIGYSVNDSVVIYDRIRENLRRFKKMNLHDILNNSTNSTLSRTVITSGTTLLALLVLVIFGGKVLFSFSLATFFGVLIGTYSSIYISAPILFYFDPRKKQED